MKDLSEDKKNNENKNQFEIEENENEKYNIKNIKFPNGIEVQLSKVKDSKEEKEKKIDDMIQYNYTARIHEKNAGIEKLIYLDKDIDFEKIQNNEEYAKVVQDFLNPYRVLELSTIAESKGIQKSVYLGYIDYSIDNENQYQKYRYDDDYMYNRLAIKEYKIDKKRQNELNEIIETEGENADFILKIARDYEKEIIESKTKSMRRRNPEIFDVKRSQVIQNYGKSNNDNEINSEENQITALVNIEEKKNIFQKIKDSVQNRLPNINNIIDNLKNKFSKEKKSETTIEESIEKKENGNKVPYTFNEDENKLKNEYTDFRDKITQKGKLNSKEYHDIQSEIVKRVSKESVKSVDDAKSQSNDRGNSR